jgi:hypothetical protein
MIGLGFEKPVGQAADNIKLRNKQLYEELTLDNRYICKVGLILVFEIPLDLALLSQNTRSGANKYENPILEAVLVDMVQLQFGKVGKSGRSIWVSYFTTHTGLVPLNFIALSATVVRI